MCIVCKSHLSVHGSEACPDCYACIYPHRAPPPRVSDLHRYRPPAPLLAAVIPLALS